MNSAQGQPSQPGQASGTQMAQQQRPQIQLYKPEMMRSLPEQFSQAEKVKWEQGLRSLWSNVEKHAPDTQPHQEAKRKLYEFSKTLTSKIEHFRTQQQARIAAQGPHGADAAKSAQVKIPDKIMQHINSFPFILPPQLTAGTPEAQKWLNDAKRKYVQGLMQMDSSKAKTASLDAMLEKRNNEGNPLSAEEEKQFREKKESLQKEHAVAQKFVDQFREQQKAQQERQSAQNQQNQANQANQQNQQNSQNQSQQSPAGPSTAPQTMPIQAGNGAPRPQMAMQQPNTSATQAINAAIENAKNQQMGGARPPMPGQNGQPPQAQGQGQQQNAPSFPNIPQHQGGQVQNIKTEAGVPPQINTAAGQLAQQQRTGSLQNNSPQSAVPQSAVPQSAGPQSATSQGPPHPLTHQAALSQAARSYSSGQTTGTPNVMGMGSQHGHPSGTGTRETNAITNKMPIPKQLPPNAAAPPHPVQMPTTRPTYSGGASNVGNGVMGQAVLPKTPGFNLEGEGERVLNKKKLDELVKQVTGGGEGLGDGEGLTGEVEESILNVADSFVDSVLQSACKNAKERGSNMLEIRDIQLTLERQYNIRIPGYASDEIRTVRKIQPAPAWISKMSAVQAAKVTRKDDN